MKSLAQTYPDEAILQQLVAKLPWGHNIALIEKVKDEQVFLTYAITAQGNTLYEQIASDPSLLVGGMESWAFF